MSPQRLFPAVAASVSEARRYTLDAGGSLAPAVEEAVALMVSELAANAVRHTTSSHFTVTVERNASQLRIAVSDSGTGDPFVRTPDASDPSGRGLQIVHTLATDWGVVPSRDGQGKTVWFVVDVDSDLEAALHTTRDEAGLGEHFDAERSHAPERSGIEGRDGGSGESHARGGHAPRAASISRDRRRPRTGRRASPHSSRIGSAARLCPTGRALPRTDARR